MLYINIVIKNIDNIDDESKTVESLKCCCRFYYPSMKLITTSEEFKAKTSNSKLPSRHEHLSGEYCIKTAQRATGEKEHRKSKEPENLYSKVLLVVFLHGKFTER